MRPDEAPNEKGAAVTVRPSDHVAAANTYAYRLPDASPIQSALEFWKKYEIGAATAVNAVPATAPVLPPLVRKMVAAPVYELTAAAAGTLK